MTKTLEERVVALEAWKSDMLNRVVDIMMTPPSKAERGQLKDDFESRGIEWRSNHPTMHIVTPEEQIQAAARGYKNAIAILNESAQHYPDNKEACKEMSDGLLDAPQPAIDWEKVAEMAVASSHKWSDIPSGIREEILKEVKAAVAEYLRQVKEGAE